MDINKCPVCGSDMDANTNVCPECGFKMEDDTVVIEMPAETPAEAEAVPEAAQSAGAVQGTGAAQSAGAAPDPTAVGKVELGKEAKTVDMICNIIIGAGIIAAILGFICFSKQDAGSYLMDYTYGGDAYTGIQNAAAGTGRNVNALTDVVAFGFGCVNLVLGMALCTFGAFQKAVLRKEAAAEAGSGAA